MSEPAAITLDNLCSKYRVELKSLGEEIRKLMKHSSIEENTNKNSDPNEIRANIVLAYRQIENAVMRLGKAIQAFEGRSESIYTADDLKRTLALEAAIMRKNTDAK